MSMGKWKMNNGRKWKMLFAFYPFPPDPEVSLLDQRSRINQISGIPSHLQTAHQIKALGLIAPYPVATQAPFRPVNRQAVAPFHPCSFGQFTSDRRLGSRNVSIDKTGSEIDEKLDLGASLFHQFQHPCQAPNGDAQAERYRPCAGRGEKGSPLPAARIVADLHDGGRAFRR